jgi:hypothetical protein
MNASSLAFGNVQLGEPATQSLTLSSTGTAAVTVNSATVTGTGYSISGVTFPLTLNAGQTATLSVAFTPSAAGTVAGQLTITSNSSSGSPATINMSGTGVAPVVDLTWDAPSSSSDPVAGYQVYRAASGNSTYTLLNTSVITATSFTDSSVQTGQTYDYVVESVDSAGIESTPSNMASVAMP